MRWWVLDLAVDRAIYRVDLRRRTYRYAGSNPRWRELTREQNARNKRQLHGLRRIRRDGTSEVFVDPTWPYTEDEPCPACGSWVPRDSPCDHAAFECPTCGRRQCLLHWRYPMRSRREALHFLAAAGARTGKDCFVRAVDRQLGERVATVWKIFTSEEDYRAYLATGRHRRGTGPLS